MHRICEVVAQQVRRLVPGRRFGLLPSTDAEFVEEKGRLLIRPASAPEFTRQDAWAEVWGLLRRKIADINGDIEEMRGR